MKVLPLDVPSSISLSGMTCLVPLVFLILRIENTVDGCILFSMLKGKLLKETVETSKHDFFIITILLFLCP